MQPKAFRVMNLMVVLALASGLAWATPSPVFAQNPAPVQIFYVTLPEDDGLAVLDTVNSAADSPMYTYFSIAIAANGTYVYYDQWENGYDSDIANPANLYSAGNPGGTQIWGNSNCADGFPPNKAGVAVTCVAGSSDANDVLNAGDVIVPYNSVDVPNSSSSIEYDGRDKVGADKSIAMARATWASGSGTLNAFAHEMYATAEWGLEYEAPVGCNTANAGAMFEYSGLSIMAAETNTPVEIDGNADGTYETTITLQEGGTYLEGAHNWGDGGCNYLRRGARVRSTDPAKPIQVVLVTGDIGSTYASRDMNLLPTSAYGSSYWSPVGVDTGDSGPTRLFLYNPSDSASIYVTCNTRGSANYRDQFGTAAYNNSNGTLNWTSQSWTEEGDDGSATTGTIYINTDSDELRFRENSTTNDAIKRTANLSGYPAATLSFELDGNSGIGSTDDIALDLSSDGGANWTLGVLTFDSDNNPNGSATTVDISSYIASNTTIRFRMIGTLETGDGDGDRWDIDNVDISVPAVATSTQSVGTNNSVIYELDDYQAAHCYASDASGNPTADEFFAIGTIDAENTAWDWSFTLFPDNFLSTDALVGLGLGRDPTSGTSTSQNGNPLWVTAACSSGGTYVYVDWNNDGTADLADLNGDGDTSDTVDGIVESTTSNGIPAAYLQSVRLFEPDADTEPYDQTGARVWSCSTANTPVRADCASAGCSLAVAWGQDPNVASAAAPGLDVGTSCPPLRLIEGTKSLALKTDNDGDGLLSPGDVATYNITVKNSGSVKVTNVYIFDTVPANTTYEPNTTEKDLTSNNGTGPWVAISDNISGTPFPLDDDPDVTPDGVLLGDLDPGDIFYVRFDVKLGADGSQYEQVNNCDTAYTDAYDLTRCATNQVATRDWGDLPDSYGTTLAQNGPRHSPSNLTLGANFDRELQGQPTVSATGDDTTLTPDDEDGVTAQAGWTIGTGGGKFWVTVGGAACTGNHYLAFWIDWNGDGDFADSGESYGQTVGCGAQTVTFDIPNQTTYPLDLYARFRLYPSQSSCGSGCSPTGFIAGGEVEDYVFQTAPLAVNLAGFSVEATGSGVTLAWETVSETNNLGFNVYRGESVDGPWTQLNAEMIPAAAPGSSQGSAYTWTDATATAGATYFYVLEDVALDGSLTRHDPVSVSTPAAPNAVGMAGFAATATGPGLAGLAAVVLAALAGAGLRRRRS